MKKRNLVLALIASSALLAACKPGVSEEPAKAYFGFGAVAHYDEGARGTQVQTTIDLVSVVVNEEGVINKLRLDTAQVNVSADGTKYKLDKKEAELIGDAGDIKSKWELLELYDMLKASPIEKEWYEQAEVFENWAIGKTLAQIESNIENDELKDGETVGVTITVDTWVDALSAALSNKVLVEGEIDEIGVGTMNSWDYSKTGNDFYVAGAAFDKDKKVLAARIDTFQLQYAIEGEKAIIAKDSTRVQVVVSEKRIRGKQELKEEYGMIVASPIGKEWYEQAASLVTLLLGKTVSAALGTSSELTNGAEVGVTMKISGYRAVLLEAEHTAFNARY